MVDSTIDTDQSVLAWAMGQEEMSSSAITVISFMGVLALCYFMAHRTTQNHLANGSTNNTTAGEKQ